MSVRDHREGAPRRVSVAIVTVSDTRTAATDRSGPAARALCEAAGHAVASSHLLPDDPERVAALVRELAGGGEVDAVILTGGTGIAPRDRTYEAVCSLIERRLEGFGELFRHLSFGEIGPAAMLSRAVAGVAGRCAVFSLPGSEAAVRLALERLILPELGHIVGLLRGPEGA